MSTAIVEFYNYLQSEKGYSKHTADGYTRDLKILFEHTTDIQSVDSGVVQTLVMQQNARDKSAKSISRLVASIRSYLNFLYVQNVLTSKVIIDVKIPKVQQILPKTLSYEQVMLLLNYGHNLRDKAIIAILYSCGLRVSELVGLNTSDINTGDKFLKVLGKGGKQRYTPMGDRAIQFLQEYLNDKPSSDASENSAIFVGKNSARLSTRAVQYMIKQRGELVGIDFGVTPHMLRHAAASHLLQSSSDIRGVQEYLGHQSITSTQVYTHLDYMALAKVYDKSHPHAEAKHSNLNNTSEISDD